MSRSRAKRLPRLWCALQGLLPLEACLAAQRGELAWPAEEAKGETFNARSRPCLRIPPAIIKSAATSRP